MTYIVSGGMLNPTHSFTHYISGWFICLHAVIHPSSNHDSSILSVVRLTASLS